jgi:hypothetical protein
MLLTHILYIDSSLSFKSGLYFKPFYFILSDLLALFVSTPTANKNEQIYANLIVIGHQ